MSSTSLDPRWNRTKDAISSTYILGRAFEPEEAYVQPFIKPLLDRPNSAYVHSTLSGANPRSYWATYDKIFDGKLLPEREPLKENDPRLRETDYSLLVTGGLHRYNKDGAQIKNHVNYANMITSQMALASQTNTMFHKSGLVRMLFWLPHDVQTFICPRTLTQKSALSMPIEVATKLDVIVSPDAEPDAPVDDLRGEARLRAPRHERVMADRVLARMDGANISLPEHRRNPQHQAAIDRKNKTKKPEPRAHGWHPDVEMSLTPEQLRDEVKSLTKDVNDFVSIAVYRFRRWVTKPDNGAAELAAIKYNWADSILGDKSPGETIRSGFYMDLYGRQLRVEREFAIHASEFPTAEQESLKKDILASSETLRETWKTINLHLRMRLRMFADEDRGVLCDPPISQYDRRQFEPLMCNKDEFWPNYPMCLLDMTPRKENLASDITSAHEATHAMRDVAQALFTRARHPIPYSLERMAPMAGHDLIRDTPIMTDPLRGGRMNANDMTNRTLTSDMFRQLVVSYLEWPFRPTTAELAASASLGDVAEGRTGLDEIDRID
ncbi:hypothetical protein MBLNU457_g3016t2 [Dothideomycetes sp. NU457]